MASQRLPLAVPIISRDGTLSKGSKMVNVYVESFGPRARVYSRPGISTAAGNVTGYGNGIFSGTDSLTTAQFSNYLSTAYFAVGNSFGVVYTGTSATLSGLAGYPAISSGRAGLPIVYNNSFFLACYNVGVTTDPAWGHIYKRDSLNTSYAWTLFSNQMTTANLDGAIGGGAFTRAHLHTDGRIYLASLLGSSQVEAAYSSDMSTWTQFVVDAIAPQTVGAFTSHGSTLKLWVGSATQVYYSATPTVSSTWSTSTYANGAGLDPTVGAGINSNDGSYFMFGTNSGTASFQILRTANGSSWSSVTSLPSTIINSTATAGIFNNAGYAVDKNGVVAFSSDMSNWVVQSVTTKAGPAGLFSFANSTAPFVFGSSVSSVFAANSTWAISTNSLTIYQTSTQATISNPNNVVVDMVYG